MYYADAFLERLYSETPRTLPMPRDVSEWPAWHTKLKAALSGLLNMEALPKVRPELRIRILEEADCGDYTRKRVLLSESDDGVYNMPCYVLEPKGLVKPVRAAIALHGHGYGSRSAVGLLPDGTAVDDTGYHKLFPVDIAKRGFVVIVPELLGFGDRRLRELADSPMTENACQKMGTSLLLYGQTLAAWRVYDVMRALDYLAMLDTVDMNRVGIMGVSGGGMICALAAIFEERLKCAVISCYANVFKESIMAVRHCIDNYIPGILQYAEMPDILALIAPKPLFIEAAENDHIFPVVASRTAYTQLEAGYALLGAGEKIDVDFFSGGHGISGAKSYDWLARYV